MSEQKGENITNKIINEFAKTIEMFDLTPLESRLFAYLYIEYEPLTLDEMSEAIGKSKTSMSTSVRSLLELNLVTRVWKKGVRKDLYQANAQLFKTFMNAYVKRWIDATNHQRVSLEEIKQQQKELKRMNVSPEKNENALNKIIEFHLQVENSFHDMKQD